MLDFVNENALFGDRVSINRSITGIIIIDYSLQLYLLELRLLTRMTSAMTSGKSRFASVMRGIVCRHFSRLAAVEQDCD